MRSAVRAGDHTQLRATLITVLTPLDNSDSAEWRRRVATSVQQLIGADGCVVILGLPGQPDGVGVGQWDGLQSVVNTWTDCYSDRNPLDLRRQRLGARVWTRYGLMPPSDFYRSDYYQKWCRPSGCLDSAGISAPVPGAVTREGLLFVTDASARRFEQGGREEQLLSLLQPAFAAAIALLALTQSWRDALGGALDLAGAPLAIARPNGELLHATPSLLSLVAAQPNGGTFLGAAQALAREMGDLLGRAPLGTQPTATKEVETPGGLYRLTATFLLAPHLGSAPIVLVALSVPAEPVPTAAALGSRFRLTPREAEVTLRVARGERDRAISESLGISHSTVRRHVEHILTKLDLHNRAAVANRICT